MGQLKKQLTITLILRVIVLHNILIFLLLLFLYLHLRHFRMLK